MGGRGKAGGIKLANDADEVRQHAGEHPRHGHQGPRRAAGVGRARLGHRRGVLRLVHARPLGQAAPPDAVGQGRASTSRRWPPRDPGRHRQAPRRSGRRPLAARRHAPRPSAARINPAALDGVAEILVLLYRCFTEGDCDLAEINPLILKPTGEVHALDAKVSLDGNAEFRHPEWEEFKATEELDDRERLARDKDLQYIGLEGTVGIIANGAGLAMSTLDVVNQVGGRGGQLPRHRRRRQRRRDGGGARGHQLRRVRALDLHQHLRRHHPGRGGGQGHRGGTRTGRPAGARW